MCTSIQVHSLIYGPQKKLPVIFSDYLTIEDNTKISQARFVCEEWSKRSIQRDIVIVIAFETNGVQREYGKHSGIARRTEVKPPKTRL